MFQRIDRHPPLWLALGAVLLIASQMRLGLGVFAWIAPAPYLRFLRIAHCWKSRVAFGGVGLWAWFLATAKIVTAPVPMVMALGFALPFAIALDAPYFG